MQSFETQPNHQSPYNNYNNYSQPQGLPQQFQNPMMAKPQNFEQGIPMFLPIVQMDPQIRPLDNNQQQPILSYRELKNLPQDSQKDHLITLLCMIAVSQLLELFFLGLMGLALQEVINIVAYIMFPMSTITLIVILKFGVKNGQIQNSCLFFTLSTILTALSLVLFSRCFNNKRPEHADSLSITTANLVLIGEVAQIFINAIITILVMIQVKCEKEKLSFIRTIIRNLALLSILCICSYLLIDIARVFVFNCFATILYTALLINCLNQILEGRFQLETDKVLKNAVAVYFGMIFPIKQIN